MTVFIRALILLAAFGSFLSAQSEDNTEKDKEAIKTLIENYYIKVIYDGGDIEKLSKGFHPEFNMYYYDQKKVQKRSLPEWINRLREVRSRMNTSNSQVEKKPQRSHEFKFIDITGYTAVAKFEIYDDGKIKYTDYLTLYKLNDGWKVVGKFFTAHE